MMSCHARAARLLLVGAIAAPPALAETYRCTNAQTGRTYVAGQNVPGDRCTRAQAATVTVSSKGDFPPEFKAELAAAIQAAKAESASARRSDGLAIGISTEQARASSWGRPRDIHRVTTASGIQERWAYTGRRALYFENEALAAIVE